MKTISVFVFWVFAALVFLSGCQSDESKNEVEVKDEAPQEFEVEGQVFVVTKGRQNIKMGALPIYFISDKEIKAISLKISEEIKTFRLEEIQREPYTQALQDIEELIEKLSEDLNLKKIENSHRELNRKKDQYKVLDGLTAEDLVIVVAGITIKENQASMLYNQYLESKRSRDNIIANGLGPKHPSVKGLDGRIKNLMTDAISAAESLKKNLESEIKKSELNASAEVLKKKRSVDLKLKKLLEKRVELMPRNIFNLLYKPTIDLDYSFQDAFFSKLPPRITLTNADGVFNFSVNEKACNEKFWVVTRGSRLRDVEFNSYDKHLWIYLFEKNKDAQMIISNRCDFGEINDFYEFSRSVNGLESKIAQYNENEIDDEFKAWVLSVKKDALELFESSKK